MANMSRLREIALKGNDPASFKPMPLPGGQAEYEDTAAKAAQPSPGSLAQAPCCVPFVVRGG